MKGPHLNRRLVLETPTRQGDGAGGDQVAWTALGEVWAEVVARSGRENGSAGVAVSRMGYAISLRAAPFGSAERPKPEQRFRDGDRVYSIETVAERDPQGRYLICLAQEELIV